MIRIHGKAVRLSSQSSRFHQEQKSGLGGTGGAGISYGTSDRKETTNDNSVTQNGSLVGSTDGSVTMTAGNGLHITGSDVIAARDRADPGLTATQVRRLTEAADYLAVAPGVVRVARDANVPVVDDLLPTTPADPEALAAFVGRWGAAGAVTRLVAALSA